MKRPKLDILSDNPNDFDKIVSSPGLHVTMSEGQWDTMLETSYEMGAVLIELDEDEEPIKFYKLDLECCPICGNSEKMRIKLDKENGTNVFCESCGHTEWNPDVQHYE